MLGFARILKVCFKIKTTNCKRKESANWTSSKWKLCSSKDSVTKMKRQAMDWKKTSVNHGCNQNRKQRTCVYRIQKDSKIQLKKKSNAIQNWPDTSPKSIYRWQRSTWKDAQRD